MNELVKRLSKLDTNRLEKLTGQLGKVVALRKEPTKAEREVQLVKEIKKKIPASLFEYRNGLVEKRNDGSISNKEKEDLDFIINYLDELNAERIAMMGELAQLRKVDIKEVAAEFNRYY